MTPQEILAPLLGRGVWAKEDESPLALSQDPAGFEALVERFYAAYLAWKQSTEDNERTRAEFDGWLKGEAFLCETLRGHLAQDGRTLRALLWVVEWAYRHPEESHWGINPLAGISCHLWDEVPAGYTAEELFDRFEGYMANGELAHNARVCRDRIWRKRPWLVSRYGESPPSGP